LAILDPERSFGSVYPGFILTITVESFPACRVVGWIFVEIDIVPQQRERLTH
jgi:hypothetical protein